MGTRSNVTDIVERGRSVIDTSCGRNVSARRLTVYVPGLKFTKENWPC
jgi:hypothetical protein